MLEITIIVVLLIAAVIFFKTQKKAPEAIIKHEHKVSVPPVEQQEPESVVASKIEDKIEEAVAKAPEIQPAELTIKLDDSTEQAPQAIQAKPLSLLLPQDSTLSRHYLAHVQSLVEQLLPSRPTDATLRRHYNAMLADRLEQALSSKEELNRLIDECQLSKQAVVQQSIIAKRDEQSIEPEVKPELSNPKVAETVPEDSMLRRHYFAQLRALAEANLPPRPTDSALRRHWQAMSDDAVQKLL